MKNLFILLFVFAFFSCKKEGEKTVSTTNPVFIPIIHPQGRAVPIDSVMLHTFDSEILQNFYNASGNKTIWQSKRARKIILEQLYNSDAEGLNPSDYKINLLQKYENNYSLLNDKELAKFDVLLTFSLQKYISHLTNGRLNPRKLYTDWDLIENKIDITTTLATLLIEDSLAIKLNQLKPQNDVYLKLKKALKIIRDFPNDAFAKIEIDHKIELNDTNISMIAIKKRLIYWKDMPYKDSLSSVYDDGTLQAIKKFQFRHGLAADGVIGKGTVVSLNFSKNQRKNQIIANLERWKWFPKDMGNEYVIINIPDYKLCLIKDKDTIRTHKVIVGRAARKTPILSSRLSHVVFNPTWTVPPTIIKEDVIPAIQKNRSYLANTNIKVFDSNGNEIAANNWKLENAKGYRYVQSPGKSNSLGMVKLIFPNRFSVYLHDTNHRDFFVKNMRSLSSGCVRVENPFELTAYVLADSINWNLDKITETLQLEKTKYVKINRKVFVHILYWTAWSEKNSLFFRDDIYSLDADLYDKLKK